MAEGTSTRKKEEKDFFFGRIIGEGAFSTVYLSRDIDRDKEFAIKVCNKNHIIREKKTEAIKREKETMLKVSSNWSESAPFFVQLYATFHNHENLFFVLSYARRGDMLKFIKKMAAKEVDVTQFYAAELVQAVEHLHKLRIVHRDLKPENILLSADMHILITDFGSAKILTEVEPEEQQNRRNSFVGTAQYVSPEILTSSGSGPASDLWALGCIIYQMVTGFPPFQSQSEYQIFQKIQGLEYSFYEGFDTKARDLVTKLLVIEPKERIGAEDDDGYPSIKRHPFFENIDFDSLFKSTPPQIQSYVGELECSDSVWERFPNMQPGMGPAEMSRMLKIQMEEGSREDSGSDTEERDPDLCSLSSEGSCLPASGNIGDLSDEERTRLLNQQMQNNEYHQFAEGRLILKQGILDKKKGLWSRRRMFLLTEGPRLFYVDPKEKVLKGEIPWSAEMRTEMRNFRIFFVHTPNRIYYLIDPTSFATKWCEAIDSVRSFYFPTNNH